MHNPALVFRHLLWHFVLLSAAGHFLTPPSRSDDHPAQPEGPASSYHVIARPQAVAISWQILRFDTLSQEIAASGFALLAMTAVIERDFF